MFDDLQISIKVNSAHGTALHKAEKKMKRIVHFHCHKQSFKHDKNQVRPAPREWPEVSPNAQAIVNDAYDKMWNLHQRRAVELRKEQRINFLAYAFLRGIPYASVEQTTHQDLSSFESRTYETNNPDKPVKKVRRIFEEVERLAKANFENFDVNPQELQQLFAQRWAEWFEAARAHIAAQHVKPEAEPAAS